MPDNIDLTPGTGAVVARTENKSGVIHTQVIILDMGGSGAEALLTGGQQTMANSLPVVLASNQTTVPVNEAGALAAPANFSVTTSAQQLIAANTARLGVFLENVDNTVTLYWGTTNGVTTANGLPIYANDGKLLPVTSAIWVIAASAISARFAELT